MSDSNNPISALNGLPPDLIEAIIPFLPSKSLGRFKSVSKRWYSLISSPEFIKTHVRNYTKNNPNPNPTHLVLLSDSDVYSVDIKQLNTQPTPATLTAKRLNFQEPLFEILGSCNGLLLANDKHRNLYIVNPSTRKSLKVPTGKHIGTYGFGYDFSTDDYKVISISRMGISDSDRDTKFVSVYSLRYNSWNMLPNFPYKHNNYGPGVLLNNNLHWVVRNKSSTLTIAAFSLASEEFHEIEFPDLINYIQGFRATCCKLCAFGGKLVVGLQFDEFEFESWVMEEYGVPKSWMNQCFIKKHSEFFIEFFLQLSNQDILLGDNWVNEIDIYNMDERRYTSVTVEGCPKEYFMISGKYVESIESLERFR
ncbi:F-box/kelch-repeat protein At3g06240-like [Rutidosis leptorrhynchoides]|uniref:F-box/kelch-repeat protein At3g06240-like n=1 Tax=Rutidosis leptorrhynchoides TaxID=125765 RepID=UPI003A99F148